MGLFFDGIIILIIVLSIFLSARRGFIRTLIEAFGYLFAVVSALWLSTPAARYIYFNCIEQFLVGAFKDHFVALAEDASADMPTVLTTLLNLAGVTEDKVATALVDGVSSAAVSLVEFIEPHIINMLSVAICTIIAILIMFAVRFLARKINEKCKDNMIGKTNRVLGGVIGAIKGIAFSVLFSLLVSFSILVVGDTIPFLSEETLETSYICRWTLDFLASIF